MPAVLSDRGNEMVADLPAYLHDDPGAWAVVDPLARELGRVEDAGAEIAAKALPHAADDEYRLLGIWEATLDLPVEAPGATLAERQGAVIARFRQRRAAAGRDWVSLMTTALGTENWSHEEISPYSVVITVPLTGGSYGAEQVMALARGVTPANLSIGLVTGEGFVVGFSAIGVASL